MKKIIYVVLDGLGDLPVEKFGGKTPLEAAQTPNIDRLAKDGKTGLVVPVGEGIAPESDVAVISLLGYDAHKHYTGRGPLESFAEGLRVNDGDIAWRVNFATQGEGQTIKDRRVGRNLTTEEATELSKEINEKVKLTSVPDAEFEFKNTIGHRGVLVIRVQSGNLSAQITNVDPAYGKDGVLGIAKEKFENIVQECLPVEGYEDNAEAQNAAKLTNEFIHKSHEVLDESEINKRRVEERKLPGNLILARDAGDSLPNFPKHSELYNIKFGTLVEMPVEKGIALLTGLPIIEIPFPTGNGEIDYPIRAKKVLEEIKNYDGLYVHLKGPDEPAHDGDAAKKKVSIEDIDKYFFEPLLKELDLDDVIVVVTADHSTPCSLKSHSADPVPILISGKGIEADENTAFSEPLCKNGSLGSILGNQLMAKLIALR